MKEIKVGKTRVAIVDDADYEAVAAFKWSFTGRYACRHCSGYAILMHRALLECPDDKEVDHINGDGLDNRRVNLRVCTRLENAKNRGKSGHNTSGYCGVYFDQFGVTEGRKFVRAKPWRAELNANKKRYRLGYFFSPVDAARAYDKAALEHHGAFARLNFPVPGAFAFLRS